MKITLAGKGGAGKTTLTSLLARAFEERGRRVLIVECDPNPNLAGSLGIGQQQLLDRPDVDPKAVYSMLNENGHAVVLGANPMRLVDEHGIRVGGIVALPARESSQGEDDAWGRGVLGVLVADRFDVVLTDLAAGPLQARFAVGGALNPADQLVVVVEPGPVSLGTGSRVLTVARDRSVDAVIAVANKVRDQGEERLARAWAIGHAIRRVHVVPVDPRVREADREHVPSWEKAGEALGAMRRLAEELDPTPVSGPS